MRARSRAIAAMGLLLLAGCGTTHLSAGAQQPAPSSTALPPTMAPPTPSPTVSAVPWVAVPGSEYVEPVDTGEPPAYRPCSAHDLSVPPVLTGPAAGTVYATVKLQNRSAVACTLAGRPAGVFELRDGTLHRVGRHGPGAYPGLGVGAANLRPGEAGVVELTWNDGCPELVAGQQDLVRSLTVELADRTRITVPLASIEGPPWNIVCGVLFSQFGPTPPPPPEETSPLDVLMATADLPARVSAGKVVHFHVTLHNGSDSPVRLDSCPSYSIWVGIPLPGTTTRYYELNCPAAPVVPADGSVTFAMQYAVGDATGTGKFGWFLQGTTVGIGSAIEVGRG